MIRSDVREAMAAVEILNNVRFIPGYVPELLNYQATQAAAFWGDWSLVATMRSKWSAM